MLSLVAAGITGCKIETTLVPAEDNVGVGEPPAPENPVQVDRIVQVSRPSVDILFVIDNSCSMQQEQALLANNFPAFLQYFQTSGLDYHIGVVSTDMEDPSQAGKLIARGGYRYIDENTTNPEVVFAQMVQLGIGGWFEERGRDAVYTALELRADDASNLDFYRDEAALDVIFVSDEDDQSELLSPIEFREWFTNLKWSPDVVTAHSIIAPETFGACQDAPEVGALYQAYTAYTGGSEFSICQSDWQPMLDTLGLEASGLLREYFLSKIPVLETLQVQVFEPDPMGGDPTVLEFEVCMAGTEEENPDCEVAYTPTRNSIVFLEFVPEPSTEIVATYNILENFSAEAVDTVGGNEE
jgi:hypothetical protein